MNNKKPKNKNGLKALINHLELMLGRQKVLIKMHDQYSCESAMSNACANTISLIIDYANGYLNGKDWPEKMAKKLERKLEARLYYEPREEK